MSFLLQISGAATTVADTASNGPGVKKISIMDLIFDGGWIMIPLAVLFILAIYIFFERFMAIQQANKEDHNFMNKIKEHIGDGKIQAAKDLCSNSDTPVARMVEKGILRIGKPMDDIAASIENVGKLEIYKLEKNLSTMATCAGAAPMIGFLGTVIGMIFTFHEMSTSGNGVQIEALSGGIMQAMVTTVAGLIIGVLAYIGYNLLVAKVEKVIHKMESTTIEFLDLLQEPGN